MVAKIPASFRVIGRAFVDWWDGWLDMVLTIVIWILAQVTIIFGPPATFGLYYVAYEMTNGQAFGVRGLIGGAKKYFWKAWLWGFLNLLVAAILAANFSFYGAVKTAWAPYLQILVMMLGFLWYCTQFYALPFFMEQENKSLFIAMRNGFLTTLAAPFFTLLIMIVAVLAIGVSFGFVLPLFLGLPGLIPFLGLRAVSDRLEAFGLRTREKTPREIEMEETEKRNAPASARFSRDNFSVDDEVAESEGNVEKGK